MTIILRPGQRILNIPGIGVRMSRRAVSSGAAAWWLVTGKTCVGAYQAKGVVSEAASYKNLANPGTYDLVSGSWPVAWDSAIGWTLAGVGGSYLDTGIVPASGWSLLCQFASTTNTGYVVGVYSGSDTRLYLRPDTTGDQLRYGNGGVQLITPRLLSGNLAVAGQQGYRNGSADGAAIGAWSGTGTGALAIGALRDVSGVPTYSSNYAGVVIAAAIYSAVLTAGEVATVSAAMAAF